MILKCKTAARRDRSVDVSIVIYFHRCIQRLWPSKVLYKHENWNFSEGSDKSADGGTWTPHLSLCRPMLPSWGCQTPRPCAGQTWALVSAWGSSSPCFVFVKIRVVSLNRREAAPASRCTWRHHVTESLHVLRLGTWRSRDSSFLTSLFQPRSNYCRAESLSLSLSWLLPTYGITERLAVIRRARRQSSGLECLTGPPMARGHPHTSTSLFTISPCLLMFIQKNTAPRCLLYWVTYTGLCWASQSWNCGKDLKPARQQMDVNSHM